MSLVNELKTELYGDEAYKYENFAVYQALAESLVDLGVDISINASHRDHVTLRGKAIEKAREQAIGSIAYTMAYDAYRQDTIGDSSEALSLLNDEARKVARIRAAEREEYARRLAIEDARENL